ncbi:DUF4124 domain-containing protein [Pseudomonas aeruginosa]|uniref:DUF4124 domain-containing protein n=1 Tax=Pseudomonas aeruginosa TaxID=287 RepID=UPI00265EB8A5|nr:DUF4124 domain-containing protein [Pseudomonas aeruginosa]MDO1593782.1 DUF4124 domain-containing protein [Pseudomonas aeruginosa]WOF37263.1 DUF4124 domain-containing protein [Pseudomonas aeruginosa]
MKRIFPVLALLLAVSSVHAATVFKCVGPDGKVTFTQQNCPENQSLDDVVSATNSVQAGQVLRLSWLSPSSHQAVPIEVAIRAAAE